MSFVFHKPYAVAKESDLVAIPPHLTRDPAKAYKAKKTAADALQKLCDAAEKDSAKIVVISSHRTFEFQKNYFDDAEKRHGKGKGALWVAPAGYSEHHTGFVFDLADKERPETDDEPSFESTKASNWLNKNAAKFGFELSFPRGNWQGVSFEPWHWRFAGDEESKNIFHPSAAGKMIMMIKTYLKAFGLLSLCLLFFALRPAFAEKISFPASDGAVLEGDFMKPAPGKITLVLLHGYMSNRPEWEPFAKYCHMRGLGVLYFDLRGHGKSQGSPQDFSKMITDLKDAVRMLTVKFKLSSSKIAVGGASVGANVAFIYAAQNKDVPFVVLLSPGMNYQGLDISTLMPSYGARPALMAASSADRYAFQTVEFLEQSSVDRSKVAVFREGPAAGHGVQMFKRNGDVPSALEKNILNWIQKNAK